MKEYLEALNTSRVASQCAEKTASLLAWSVSHASEFIPFSVHSGSQRIPIAVPSRCWLHWNGIYMIEYRANWISGKISSSSESKKRFLKTRKLGMYTQWRGIM